VARLPVSYLTFEVTHEAPPVAEPPCLANRFLTFGSLVTQYKVTPAVIDAWSAILRGSPGSRLILSNRTLDSKQNAEWLRQRFAERELDASRLTILPPASHLEFLRYYDQIDLALDPFPYNGGTTTMEAIWQGVPVLSFDGDRWASRTSQTILRRTHLAEFVAPNAEAMIDTAITLATDPATPVRLATLRRAMRDRLSASSACDGAALARAMEALYLRLLNS
jgi:predicted O-linked N-acetylglucosamine transferase (SPINDLY family)